MVGLWLSEERLGDCATTPAEHIRDVGGSHAELLEYSTVGRPFGRKENAVSVPEHSKVAVGPSLTRAYDPAWALYEARCLWNVRRVAHATPEDASDGARRLRQYGDMRARRLATRIEGEASAA